MKHRHLSYAPESSAETLPSAALVDLLERGDLSDWQPLLAAIARNPNGALAQRTQVLVDRFPMYGTSTLMRTWIDRVRAVARRADTAQAEVRLKDLRRSMGLTQAQLAHRMNMSQSDLSKLERRSDVRISTLRSYIEALGGRIAVVAELPAGVRRITLAATANRVARNG